MSRRPSRSRSTNCGVEVVHHHTPGTSATAPSAFSHSPWASFADAEVLVDANLPTFVLPDEQVLLAVAIDVGPARACPAWVLDPHRHAGRLEPHRRLELGRPCECQGSARQDR